VIKNLFEGAKVLIALFALMVAVRSCQRSNDAHSTAIEALATAERHFVQEHRPYLVITPSKFKDDNTYVKLSRDGNRIEVKIRYEIMNRGNVPAKDISSPTSYVLGNEINLPKFQLRPPPVITLGPGDTTVVEWGTEQEYATGDVARKEMEYFASPQWKGANLYFGVTYHNGLEPSLAYTTVVAHIFKKDTTILLKSEMNSVSSK